MRFAMVLAYDGSSFCGWQVQKGSAAGSDPSIQETVKSTLESIVSEPVQLTASGRTDSGVHASAQVVHFDLARRTDWPEKTLLDGLNSRLPLSIRVRAVRRAPNDFHAQRSATRKQYSYYFLQGPSSLPHLNRYALWLRKTLDVDAMNQAAQFLIGEHDFKPFQGAKAATKTSVRTVLQAEVTREPVHWPLQLGEYDPRFYWVRVRVQGTGFLKQMMRSVSGTLLEVGFGHEPPVYLREILETSDRSRIGKTLNGRGLWLDRVWYDRIDFDPLG